MQSRMKLLAASALSLVVLGLLVLGTSATALTSDSAGTGVIRGLVFNDIDGDGAQGVGEPNMPGWWVYVIGPHGAMRQLTGPTGGYMFTNVPRGEYLICEHVEEGWTQTYPQTEIRCPDGSQGWTGIIQQNGQIIRVHFGNHMDEVPQEFVTRTQGFWSTHTEFTSSMFQTHLGGTMPVGGGSHFHNVTNWAGDGNSTLFGAYYANIAKKSNGEQRDAVDHARMVLLQQLVTAKINCGVFGCPSETMDAIADADNAFAIGDIAQMNTDTNVLDAYNNSGDGLDIPPEFGSTGSATPNASKDKANIPYWDSP